jgi:hypothetical protein
MKFEKEQLKEKRDLFVLVIQHYFPTQNLIHSLVAILI